MIYNIVVPTLIISLLFALLTYNGMGRVSPIVMAAQIVPAMLLFFWIEVT